MGRTRSKGTQQRLPFAGDPAGVARREVVVGGRRVTCLVRSSRRARTWRLEFTARDGLVAVLPARLGFSALRRILNQKQDWVLRQLKDYGERTRRRERRRLRHGGPFLYRGREYLIKCTPARGDYGDVVVFGGEVRVNVPRGDERALRAAVMRWLRRRTREVVTPVAIAEGMRMRVRFGRIFVRDQRTRWASCSDAGNLNFNCRLAMAPPRVVRYLVVHELAHLKTLEHGRRFWDLVRRYYPRYRAAELWLRDNEELFVF